MVKLLIVKYLLTAAVIVIVSEVAKRLDRVGALISSLPLVTLLVLIWLYAERQPQEKIANHAWYTFWYVIPTLPMFALFPFMLARLGFWWTLVASVAVTLVSFVAVAWVARRFGVELI